MKQEQEIEMINPAATRIGFFHIHNNRKQCVLVKDIPFEFKRVPPLFQPDDDLSGFDPPEIVEPVDPEKPVQPNVPPIDLDAWEWPEPDLGDVNPYPEVPFKILVDTYHSGRDEYLEVTITSKPSFDNASDAIGLIGGNGQLILTIDKVESAVSLVNSAIKGWFGHIENGQFDGDKEIPDGWIHLDETYTTLLEVIRIAKINTWIEEKEEYSTIPVYEKPSFASEAISGITGELELIVDEISPGTDEPNLSFAKITNTQTDEEGETFTVTGWIYIDEKYITIEEAYEPAESNDGIALLDDVDDFEASLPKPPFMIHINMLTWTSQGEMFSTLGIFKNLENDDTFEGHGITGECDLIIEKIGRKETYAGNQDFRTVGLIKPGQFYPNLPEVEIPSGWLFLDTDDVKSITPIESETPPDEGEDEPPIYDPTPVEPEPVEFFVDWFKDYFYKELVPDRNFMNNFNTEKTYIIILQDRPDIMGLMTIHKGRTELYMNQPGSPLDIVWLINKLYPDIREDLVLEDEEFGGFDEDLSYGIPPEPMDSEFGGVEGDSGYTYDPSKEEPEKPPIVGPQPEPSEPETPAPEPPEEVTPEPEEPEDSTEE